MGRVSSFLPIKPSLLGAKGGIAPVAPGFALGASAQWGARTVNCFLDLGLAPLPPYGGGRVSYISLM